MGRVSSTCSPKLYDCKTYKDDSFGRGCGAGIAIGLAGRNFETHILMSQIFKVCSRFNTNSIFEALCDQNIEASWSVLKLETPRTLQMPSINRLRFTPWTSDLDSKSLLRSYSHIFGGFR